MGSGRKKAAAAALSVLGLGSVLAAGSGAMASYVVHGKRQTLEEAIAWQRQHYDISWFEDLECETYTVSSYDGYVLHAQLCTNRQPSEKYVIITHGYTDNRFGMLKYMKLYLDRGYNCVIYDLRGHGENAPAPCSYSIREGKDLYAMILDTRTRYPQLKVLGLHGESLGAASTVSVLGYQIWAKADRIAAADGSMPVDFAVADCGFADIENVLEGAFIRMLRARGKTGERPVTTAMAAQARMAVACAGAASKVLYGYSFSEMKPITHLAANTVPLLFLHGEEDAFILPENSRRMAEATPGLSEFHLLPGAGHAESVLKQPELYREYLYAFLDRVGC